MKKKYKSQKCLLLFLLIPFFVKAQNHFIKIIDFDTLSQSSQQIIKQDNHYLLGYYQTCKSDLVSQCSGVIKIDENGNIVDKVFLEKFSNNSNSILLTNNDILLSGEVYNFQVDAHEFLIHQLDKVTLDSITVYTIFSESQPLVKMFQLSSTIWNDKFIIAGNGRIIENSYNRGTVYVVNKDYSLDTLLYFDFANKNISIWNVFSDNANNLNVCFQYANDNEYYTSIMKFDTNYNMLWHWRSPAQLAAKAIPHGFETGTGNIILNLDDKLWPAINRINCIRPDSTISWIATWPGNSGNQERFVDRLRLAKNGDILGVGRCSDISTPTKLFRVPFVFRIDPNGNFKWIKVYYKEQYYNNGDLVQGGFSDIIETDDGDLIAVGRIHNVLEYDPKIQGSRNDWDILIARFGADGCLESGCEEFNKIEIINDVNEGNKIKNIKIYPNPSPNGDFNIELNFNNISKYKVEVFDLSGKIISLQELQVGFNKIYITNSGMYIIKLYEDAQMIHQQKIVKI